MAKAQNTETVDDAAEAAEAERKALELAGVQAIEEGNEADLNAETVDDAAEAAEAERKALELAGVQAIEEGNEADLNAETVAALAGAGRPIPSGWAFNARQGFFKHEGVEKPSNAPMRVQAPE